MHRKDRFNFSHARRFSEAEREIIRRAIQKKTGRKVPRRGRPAKGDAKYRPVSIRLHPDAMAWAKREAHRRGIGYQTVINETLLRFAA